MTNHRYVSPGGSAAISMSRVPGEEMTAGVRTEVRECLGEARVRYHHISILSQEIVGEQEGVKQRRGKEVSGAEEDHEKKTPVKSKDPLKWFGVLSPPSLKQSQEGLMIRDVKIEKTFSGRFQVSCGALCGLRQPSE